MTTDTQEPTNGSLPAVSKTPTLSAGSVQILWDLLTKTNLSAGDEKLVQMAIAVATAKSELGAIAAYLNEQQASQEPTAVLPKGPGLPSRTVRRKR
jgi:hypothetical protein